MKELLMQRPSQVISNTIQGTEYNLYLHGEIGHPDDFMEHFAVYKTANENDCIRLWVNSLGGSISTGVEYIQHMRECHAPIVAVIGVDCASMASALTLEADEIEVCEMSTMLVHAFSYGVAGVESHVYNHAAFNKKLNERFIRNTYSQFLSPDQLTDVLKGVDVLLSSEEILACWENLQQSRQEDQEDFSGIQQGKSIDEIVAKAVEEGSQKVIDRLLKKFDLVPKAPKPARKKVEPRGRSTTPLISAEDAFASEEKILKFT